MPRRKGKTKVQRTQSDSSDTSSNESEIEPAESAGPQTRSKRKAPAPRAKQAGGRKRAPPKYTADESESESVEEDDSVIRRHPYAKTNKNNPPTGICCKKHRRYQSPSFTHIRTLYSQFPRDGGRLIFLHLLSTFLIYLLVYPMINFIWTYMINIDDEVATLFHYITEEPSYEGGLFNHFRKLKWLAWPPFTAESVSLLLASAIKDTAVLHWEGLMDDMSLTDLVGGHIAKRYRR